MAHVLERADGFLDFARDVVLDDAAEVGMKRDAQLLGIRSRFAAYEIPGAGIESGSDGW